MSDPSAGILRFEVCGQIFAIPMADLAGIRQISETTGETGESAAEPGPAGVYVASTPLASLFYGQTPPDGEGFIIIVHTAGQMYVLRVDRVLAGTDLPAEEQTALPSIIAAHEGPFTGMFKEADRWGLIIDAGRLAGLIRQRYPDPAVEHVYEIR